MKTLANAPIIEALAQINYEIGRPINDSDLHGFLNLFSGFKSEEISQVEIKPGAPPQLNRFGFRLSNDSTQEFIQITKDFFAYSKTSKYKDWEDFRGCAQKAFERFMAASGTTNINRVALRYINKIEVPNDLAGLSRFLKIYPVIGEIAENKPETLILQFTMPIKSIEARANIAMRLDRTADEKHILVFDIDTFTTGKFKGSADDVMTELAKLRTVKNDIFRKGLTDDAIASFDK